MILTFIIGNVSTDSRNFHDDSTNWSPTTATSLKGQMREANVAMSYQYAHQDGTSTSGSMHQSGSSTSGSAQWRSQDASENGPWRHQGASENGPLRHQDMSENGPWRHQDVAQTGGSVPLRSAGYQNGAARSDRLAGPRQLSLAYQTPSQPPSSAGSRPPMVYEDSGMRGLRLLTSEDILPMEELPPLYSA